MGGASSKSDLEDVLADAYVTAATKIRNDPTLEVRNMAGWFRRVLFLTCLERSRYDRREQQRFVTQLQEEDDSLDLIAGYNPHFDLQIALQKALKELKDDERTIVTMAAEGHTSNEIAEKLGGRATPASVRKEKSRVLAVLQKMLGGIQVWAR